MVQLGLVEDFSRLKKALAQLELECHKVFVCRSLEESAFSSLKQRTRAFFNNITVNLKRGKAWSGREP